MAYNEDELEYEIDLEDLAMGKLPKGAKKQKLSPKTAKEVATISKMVTDLEKRSVATYKMYEGIDKEALLYAYEELVDAIYSTRNMIRDAKSASEKKATRKKHGMLSEC